MPFLDDDDPREAIYSQLPAKLRIEANKRIAAARRARREANRERCKPKALRRSDTVAGEEGKAGRT